MMKRLFISFILIFFSISFLNAQEVIITYNFDKPTFKDVGNGYSEIIYTDCRNYGETGTPLIPFYAADVLLPFANEISQVKVISFEYYEAENGITLKPANQSLPISVKQPENYSSIPNQEIYNSSEIYPAKVIENIATYFLSGHSIGTFTVCPVQYSPSNNDVKCLKQITLQIDTKVTGKSTDLSEMLTTNSSIRKRINSIVDNPESLKSYAYDKSKIVDEYDLLLITSQTFLPYFDEYITFKTNTGYSVITKTTEDIYSDYTGSDEAEKIRNCIIDIYTNYGLSFVLLGGDADANVPAQNIVPCRSFYVDPGYSGYEDYLPSDMYYACLDGNWNSDQDNFWGEPGEDDLFYEVAVGRLCVDSQTEIENFINKLILYQDAPVISDITKVTFIGEQLDDITYGDDSKDEIEGISSNNGYTTQGVPENITINRLYESVSMWEMEDVFAAFNTGGVNILNHLGHSDVNYNMKMYNSDLTTTNFQNDGISRGFAIGYSQGCYNGSLDNRTSGANYLTDDSFAEKITTIATAEVATIANSRYGWYDPGGTNGASQFLDRQFFDAIFGEGFTQIGDANSDSKQDNASYMNTDPLVRWCAYETNLFGDPSMDIWTDEPVEIAATYLPNISIGISEISFTTDAPFARIGLVQNNILIGRGLADEDGNCDLQLFDPLITTQNIQVVITAHNRIKHLGTIIPFSDQPYIAYSTSIFSDSEGNNNNMIEFGENISLSLNLKNFGNQPATNVSVTISSTDEFITITDATENYGDFEPTEEILINNGFAFTVADNVPDNHKINFQISSIGESEWISTFYLTAYAPLLKINSYIIDDSVLGNGNNRLDPDETATITFEIANTGHGDCSDVEVIFNSISENAVIEGSPSEITQIIAGNISQISFDIVVSENVTNGILAPFSLDVTSGSYSAALDLSLKIGLIVEDWETGDFTKFDWTNNGNANWAISTQTPYEGTYCTKSGNVDNYQSSELLLEYDVVSDDNISFYYKVSSESGWDYLEFYIDEVMLGNWSGEVDWSQASYPVTTGNHTFKWEYAKDESLFSGDDCAWVDFIELPVAIEAVTYAITFHVSSNGVDIENSQVDLNGYGSQSTDLYGETTFISVLGMGAPGIGFTVNSNGYFEYSGNVVVDNIKTIEIELQQTVEIENELTENVLVYPNPTTGILYFKNTNNSDLELYSIDGKQVVITVKNNFIDLSQLSKGTYILKIINSDKVQFQKIELR
jgi:hypothetical protein